MIKIEYIVFAFLPNSAVLSRFYVMYGVVLELSSKPTFVTLFQIYAELVSTMSGKVSLRVKCEGGQGVVRGLLAEDSLEKLISHALEQLGLATADHQATVRILNGFPPKPVDLSDRDKSISSAGIRSGDTIIFQVGQSQTSSSSSSSQSAQAGDSTSTATAATATVPQSLDAKSSSNKRLKTDNVGSGPSSGKLQRKVVPADNSCLFTSINYCMSGAVVGSEHSAFMREVIASVVSSDPAKYCEAYLGRTNADYTRWIQTKEAWGGAIEVQILSEYFQVQKVVHCIVLYRTVLNVLYLLYCTYLKCSALAGSDRGGGHLVGQHHRVRRDQQLPHPHGSHLRRHPLRRPVRHQGGRLGSYCPLCQR